METLKIKTIKDTLIQVCISYKHLLGLEEKYASKWEVQSIYGVEREALPIKLCKTLITCVLRHGLVKFTYAEHHQKKTTPAIFSLKISVQKPVLVKHHYASLTH